MEVNLVITFTEIPNDEQMESVKDFVKGFELSNENAKVLVVTPRPPR